MRAADVLPQVRAGAVRAFPQRSAGQGYPGFHSSGRGGCGGLQRDQGRAHGAARGWVVHRGQVEHLRAAGRWRAAGGARGEGTGVHTHAGRSLGAQGVGGRGEWQRGSAGSGSGGRPGSRRRAGGSHRGREFSARPGTTRTWQAPEQGPGAGRSRRSGGRDGRRTACDCRSGFRGEPGPRSGSRGGIQTGTPQLTPRRAPVRACGAGVASG